jgi:hypothetical protein
MMRNRFTLGIATIVFASTSLALAYTTSWAWSEQKAEQIVARDAKVKLQRSERVKLENELLASVRLYGGLALAAAETQTSGTPFGVLASRFSKALATVRSGSKIDAADCRGSGKATAGRRFSRFSCAVTSQALEIPSVELVYSEGAELPTVIEGSPRMLGPWKGRLDVRVVGRSAMRYAQAQ